MWSLPTVTIPRLRCHRSLLSALVTGHVSCIYLNMSIVQCFQRMHRLILDGVLYHTIMLIDTIIYSSHDHHLLILEHLRLLVQMQLHDGDDHTTTNQQLLQVIVHA